MATGEIRGRVTALVDHDGGVRADVALDTPPACARCQSGKGCGAGVFAARSALQQVRVDVPAGSSVAIGDTVCLGLVGTSVSAAALTAYGFPLGGALSGGVLGQVSSLGDAYSAALAGAGLLLGAGLARRLTRQLSDDPGARCQFELRGHSS